MTKDGWAATGDIDNQPPPLENHNLFTTDRALREATLRDGAAWAESGLVRYGATLGTAEVMALGRQANQNPPRHHPFDRFGQRRDEVEFHPAWHAIMQLIIGEGLHAAPFAEPRPGAHVARAAAYVMHGQVEPGSLCPTTMTHGAISVLQRDPELALMWLPTILSRTYDSRAVPVTQKSGALIGMGMTERQGGSDLRANTTRALPVDGSGPWETGSRAYRLTGHKWFFSAPQSDAHLVLAQAPGGLSCFFMPRVLPDGSRNAIQIQRLKDKIGNRSNASAEVEFDGAWAVRLGEEGRGVSTILEMGTYTRLDCALGSAGLLRGAVAQALHHAAHRSAFQLHLVDHPLMGNVLADLALESEAAIALSLRLARAFDEADHDPASMAFRRVCTPMVKYWVCKRAPVAVTEAMEVLGGNGYVEEGPLALLYREAPLNSIWEGSGNVMCLDMLRAINREPGTLDVLFAELRQASGADRRLDTAIAALETEFTGRADREHAARRLAEALSVALQASLLVRHAPAAIADAFCASRLGGQSGRAFGAMPAGVDCRAIIARAMPCE